MAEEIELKYVELLKENNLTEQDLPQEISKQVAHLKGLKSRYQNKPTTGNKTFFDRQNVIVADAIINFLEKDLEEETPPPLETPDPLETPAPIETPAPVDPPTPSVPTDDELVIKIRSKLDRDNIIRSNDLANIIGKKPNDPVHEIGSLKLRRIRFTYNYQAV